MIAGGGDAKQAKAAEKSRKEEIEAEKKRIREVNIASHHVNNMCSISRPAATAAAVTTTAALLLPLLRPRSLLVKSNVSEI